MNLLSFFTSGGHEILPISFNKFDESNIEYVAFGHFIQIDENNYYWIGREAVDHFESGSIIKIAYDVFSRKTTKIVSDIILDPTYDIRGGSSVIIDGSIHVYAARFDRPTFISLSTWKSTDGLVGESFGSMVDLSSFLTYQFYNFYGKPLLNNGRYLIPWYEHNGTDWRVNLLHTTDGTSYANINVSSGTGTTDDIGESWLVDLGASGLLLLGRKRTTPFGIYQNLSTDNGDTWGGWSETNLGSSVENMATGIVANDGLLYVYYADRITGWMRLTKGNTIATILGNPMAYVNPVNVEQGLDLAGKPLGYPDILQIFNDEFLMCHSFELPASREQADLYVGVGTIDHL